MESEIEKAYAEFKTDIATAMAKYEKKMERLLRTEEGVFAAGLSMNITSSGHAPGRTPGGPPHHSKDSYQNEERERIEVVENRGGRGGKNSNENSRTRCAEPELSKEVRVLTLADLEVKKKTSDPPSWRDLNLELRIKGKIAEGGPFPFTMMVGGNPIFWGVSAAQPGLRSLAKRLHDHQVTGNRATSSGQGQGTTTSSNSVGVRNGGSNGRQTTIGIAPQGPSASASASGQHAGRWSRDLKLLGNRGPPSNAPKGPRAGTRTNPPTTTTSSSGQYRVVKNRHNRR